MVHKLHQVAFKDGRLVWGNWVTLTEIFCFQLLKFLLPEKYTDNGDAGSVVPVYASELADNNLLKDATCFFCSLSIFWNRNVY